MSVTINSPASGATLKGTVTVTAAFVGSRFDIATVTIDGKQLASDSTQPLSFQIDTTRVTDGAHTLTVAVRAGRPKRWQKASIPVRVSNAAPLPSNVARSKPTMVVTV